MKSAFSDRLWPLFFTGLLMATAQALSGDLSFQGATEKEQPVFQAGESIVFRVQLREDGKPAGGKMLRWKRTGDDAHTETGEAVSSEKEPLTLTTSMNKPGFVRLEVWPVNDQGKALLDEKNLPIRFDGGAAVEPEKLSQALPEPPDFDEFWAGQIARLKDVPVKATFSEVPSTDPAYRVYDVKIDCAGGKPVSGYLTKPKDAAPQSLRANATYMGYGVGSAKPYQAPGTLTLCINAHGIENGRDPEYYRGLNLAKYGFNPEENARPETSYFLGMILRVVRSLEFLKTQPEWNGKDLFVSGGSQGGFQAIAGAALDKEVTKCFVNVPWFCDLGGPVAGRLKGWRPDLAEGLGYFDTVNMARRVRADTLISAGLGDYVCPPSGVAVLYNNLAGEKRLTFLQGKTHQTTPKDPQKLTFKSSAAPVADSGTDRLAP